MLRAIVFAALTIASLALAADPKDTMCVKLKNGLYRCKASGKIEKEPCCYIGNDPTPAPKTKK